MSSFQKPPTVSDDYRAVDIYRKAAEVIFKKGFNSTSMGDIAEAVDLTKGGLYYYIKGKKALLFAIMCFAMDLLENEVLQEAQREKDPRLRLKKMITGHLKVVLRDPSAMTLLVDEGSRLDPDHLEKVAARKRDYTAMLRDAVRDLQRQNDLPGEPAAASRVDADVAAQSLIGMVHWTVRWYDGPEDETAYGAIAEQLTRLALGGVLFAPGEIAEH